MLSEILQRILNIPPLSPFYFSSFNAKKYLTEEQNFKADKIFNKTNKIIPHSALPCHKSVFCLRSSKQQGLLAERGKTVTLLRISPCLSLDSFLFLHRHCTSGCFLQLVISSGPRMDLRWICSSGTSLAHQLISCSWVWTPAVFKRQKRQRW